jgi:hypothetical protein
MLWQLEVMEIGAKSSTPRDLILYAMMQSACAAHLDLTIHLGLANSGAAI